MFFFALLGLVTMGLLAAEAFSSRRMNRNLWRDGFMVTVTRERLGLGNTPSEIEGRPANPWRAEVWLHGEDGQLPRSLPFVKARLKMPPPARVHLLDGSLYAHAGPADYRELDGVVQTMVEYAKELSAAARSLRGQAFATTMVQGSAPDAQRLQALDLLLTYFPASLEADLAAKDAVLDPHPAVRLRGARALGEVGFSVAEAIVRDDDAAEGVRVEALQHLASYLPRGQVAPLVLYALASQAEALRASAGHIAGQLALREAVPQLLQHLDGASTSSRRRLLTTLRRIGDPRIESAAIANLDHDDPQVGREAVRCLSRVGRPAKVVSLLKAWLRAKPHPAPVQEQAEAVIEALGRPADEDRGYLSLVNDGSLGAISVPPVRGAMALTAGDDD